MFRIVVLISGNGSNLQAIIDDQKAIASDIEIAGVISNNANAYGLVRAQRANIPVYIITKEQYSQRIEYDKALAEIIDSMEVDLIVLAGFMRVLSAEFVHHYLGKIINIHPSLLPKYPGLNTHEQALAAKDTFHGCSIHFVTEDLDEGPVIAQATLTINDNDDKMSLKERVQVLEHQLYPKVIRLFTKDHLELRNNEVYIKGKKLTPPLQGNNLENI